MHPLLERDETSGPPEPRAAAGSGARAGSCSSPARPGSARPRSCGASATSQRARASSGARATRCSRRARSGRSSTSRERGRRRARGASSAGGRDAARGRRGAARASCAAPAATMLVLEDVHWADEATLDVLRLLARRIETLPALVLATYRDDELDRAHPLRIVLGELRAPAVDAGRARAAVAGGGGRAGRAARRRRRRAVPRAPAGNPFFVTEVLAAGGGEIPATVRDAVLARAARLEPDARARCSTRSRSCPPQAELWLLEALAGDAVGQLEECLAVGHARARAGARRVPARAGAARGRGVARRRDRRSRCTARALAALAAPPTARRTWRGSRTTPRPRATPTRCCGLRRAAAERAAALGAHREAAAQYARALRSRRRRSALERRPSCSSAARYECYLTGEIAEARRGAGTALRVLPRARRPAREGDALRCLSRMLVHRRRTAEAAAPAPGVELLEPLGPGPSWRAYAAVAHLS